MSKNNLLTLKDINVWAGNKERFVSVNKLKKEAIKWVKSFFPFDDKGQPFVTGDFMEFHNITESDLEEKDEN